MLKPWIWILAVLSLLTGGLLWWWLGPVAVDVVAPSRGPAVEAIYATGIVEPTVMLPIAPREAGQLAELNVDEGASVHKGQALARLDDVDLRNTVEELNARAVFARQHFQRMQAMVERNVLARTELDKASAESRAADAALRRANALKDFLVLTAPADGLILRRDGEIGQYIPVGQPVFYLSCCAPLRVTAEVDEEDIPRVVVGQKVVLRADAFPGRVFDGAVLEITPKGDPVARSYRVRIGLNDPAGLLVGMTVDANLVVSERQDALLIPGTAVQNGAVWVVEDGRLRQQAVKVGVVGPQRTEILEGLDDRSQVVDHPSEKLRADRSVRIRQSTASTPVP